MHRTWQTRLLIAQKYQGEVVYQEESIPALMKAMLFISTLPHPLMI